MVLTTHRVCAPEQKPRHAAGLSRAPLFPFINARSGGNLGQERAEWMRAHIPMGRLGEMTVAGPDDNFRQAQRRCLRLCQEHQGIILLSGGDGTINGWLQLLAETRQPFALIPSGTFNLFARDHGIPVDPLQALEVALQGEERSVSIGRINGLPFAVSAGIGLHSRIIERRESDTREYGRNRLVALLSSLYTAFTRLRPFSARVATDHALSELRTSMILATLSRSHLEPLGIPFSSSLREEQMACCALRSLTWKDFLAFAWRRVSRRLESYDPQLWLQETRQANVALTRRHVKACLDGELCELQTPLEIRVQTGAVRLMMPSGTLL